MDDDTIKDDELNEAPEGDEELVDGITPKKKKGLLDDENIESADDLAEDELEEEEEPFDDVDAM